MRHLVPIVALLAVLLTAGPARAAPPDVWVGDIVATTSTNNQTTATPFVLPRKGSVQCTGGVYVGWGTSSAAAATSAHEPRYDAFQFFDIDPTPTYRFLAILPVSGTVTCHVYERKAT